ncbi:uncharacterized protein TNCV_1381841 [Trichonephila clavipes]|nr:uncharacterized protein TNCV_1381841 [Trichonephila clavipes]
MSANSKRVCLEGRKVRSGYLPFGTNASTLPITPQRSSSRDVGTSSYRYHTATYSPDSVSANRRLENCVIRETVWLLLWWIEGTTTAAREGCSSYHVRVSNDRRKVRSGYLPFRTNESTLPITPRRSSLRDVGTSSYRYHTTTV